MLAVVRSGFEYHRVLGLLDRKNVTVVALGGNAILQHDEPGTFDQQYKNIKDTTARLADVIEAGQHIVITHGNGPQIGATLIRHEMESNAVRTLPQKACVASIQR